MLVMLMYLGTVSLTHLGGKTGILCTEKGAPKPLVKRPPGVLDGDQCTHLSVEKQKDLTLSI